jgi:hypothetical protein
MLHFPPKKNPHHPPWIKNNKTANILRTLLCTDKWDKIHHYDFFLFKKCEAVLLMFNVMLVNFFMAIQILMFLIFIFFRNNTNLHECNRLWSTGEVFIEGEFWME